MCIVFLWCVCVGGDVSSVGYEVQDTVYHSLYHIPTFCGIFFKKTSFISLKNILFIYICDENVYIVAHVWKPEGNFSR